MTILALSSSQVVRLQERMAGNVRDTDLAFQGAEAGLRDAELYVQGLTAGQAHALTRRRQDAHVVRDGHTSTNCIPAFDLKSQDVNSWWLLYGRDYQTSATTDLPGIQRDPKFVIEKAGKSCDTSEAGTTEADCRYYFRKVAQSAGGTRPRM